MNKLVRTALLSAIIAAMAAFSAFSAPLSVSARELDRVTIYDQSGQALESSANSITEIQDGFSFQTGETELQIETESASILLRSNSLLLILSSSSDNPQFLLLEGAAEFKSHDVSSPVLASTPAVSVSFFSNGLVSLVSTSDTELVFADGTSAVIYSKVSGKRSALADGMYKNLGKQSSKAEAISLDEFRLLEIKAVCSYKFDFGTGEATAVMHDGSITVFYPQKMNSDSVSRFAAYSPSASYLSDMGISIVSINKSSIDLSCPSGMTSAAFSDALKKSYSLYSSEMLSDKTNFNGFLMGSRITGVIGQGSAVLSGPSSIPSEVLSLFAEYAQSKAVSKTYTVSFDGANVTVKYADSVSFSQVSGFLSDTLSAFSQARSSKLVQGASQASIAMSAPAFSSGEYSTYKYTVSASDGKAVVTFPEAVSIDVIKTAASSVFAGARVSSTGAGKASVTYQALISDKDASSQLCTAIGNAIKTAISKIDAASAKAQLSAADAQAISAAQSDSAKAQNIAYQKQLAGEKSTVVAWKPSSDSISVLANAFSLYKDSKISEDALKAMITGKSAVEMTENSAKFKLLSASGTSSLLIPDYETSTETSFVSDGVSVHQISSLSETDEIAITLLGEQYAALFTDGVASFSYPPSATSDQISEAIALMGTATGTSLAVTFPSEGVAAVAFDSAQYTEQSLASQIEQSLNDFLSSSFEVSVLGQKVTVIATDGMLIVPYRNLPADQGTVAKLATAVSKHSELFLETGYMAVSDMIIFKTRTDIASDQITSLFTSALEEEYTKMFPAQEAAPAPALSAEPAPAPVLEAEPAAAAAAAAAETEIKPVQGKKASSFDFGVKTDLALDYNFGLKVSAKAVAFLRWNSLYIGINAFDSVLYPFSAADIAARYKPTGTTPIAIGRYVLQYIDEFKFGTTDSTFHLYLGSNESLKFGNTSFISTLDHGFDLFLDSDRVSFYSSLNSDVFDYTLFIDDVSALARDSVWGGLRLSVSPFAGYPLEISAGAFARAGSLSLSSVSLYPMIDIGIPVVRSSSFSMTLYASMVHDSILPFSSADFLGNFLAEARVGMKAGKGSFDLEIGAAYNKGKRFSSMINDTQARSVGGYFDGANSLNGTSLDLIVKGSAKLWNRLSVFGYVDIPFDTESWSISDSNIASLNSDVAMLNLDLDFDKWGLSLDYSHMGMTTRVSNLIKGFKREYSIKTALKDFVDSRYSILTFGAYANFGIASVQLNAGFNTKEGTTQPVVSIKAVIDLSKGTLSK
jgi:hypothetical protein